MKRKEGTELGISMKTKEAVDTDTNYVVIG